MACDPRWTAGPCPSQSMWTMAGAVAWVIPGEMYWIRFPSLSVGAQIDGMKDFAGNQQNQSS